MDIKFYINLFLVSTILTVGCATTSYTPTIVSRLNPDAIKKSYSSFLIIAHLDSLQYQKDIEVNILNKLKSKYPNIVVKSSIDSIFPPITVEKIKNTAEKNNLESALIIEVLNAQKTSGETNTYGTLNENVNGNYSFTGSSSSRSKLNVTFEAYLVNINNSQRIWSSQSTHFLKTANDVDSFIGIYSSLIVKELENSHLINIHSNANIPNEYDDIIKNIDSNPIENLNKGFGFYNWGEPPDSNMSLLEQTGNKHMVYTIAQYNPTIFNIQSSLVKFWYKDNKLTRVDVLLGNPSDRLTAHQGYNLKYNALKLFGKPTETSEARDFMWQKTKNRPEISLFDITQSESKIIPNDGKGPFYLLTFKSP